MMTFLPGKKIFCGKPSRDSLLGDARFSTRDDASLFDLQVIFPNFDFLTFYPFSAGKIARSRGEEWALCCFFPCQNIEYICTSYLIAIYFLQLIFYKSAQLIIQDPNPPR